MQPDVQAQVEVICAAQLRQRDEEIPATLQYRTANDAEGGFEEAENRNNLEKAIQKRTAWHNSVQMLPGHAETRSFNQKQSISHFLQPHEGHCQ